MESQNFQSAEENRSKADMLILNQSPIQLQHMLNMSVQNTACKDKQNLINI